ncbi:hypothetical protein P280DRAFT_397991 [Massarina eburnea CBS 473.64]|uniref:Uncharacterized protein n=1 Tax=Massarina eburnea CBS 473.64 TaxID=1395130 RepID=A0A6A6S2Q4_9PLEO|nr:hypothetical protein P280DRAFT_397991 [Massarina eburnea CBS 473.64]
MVLVLYFLVISYVISGAVVIAGQGLFTDRLCFASGWICLILYTFAKFVIYIFLIQRVHVVRAPFVPLWRDWVYLALLVLTSTSFLSVAINAYLSVIIQLHSNGRCYIGIPGKASIPFMAVDIFCNIVLTAVFVYLLRPVIKVHGVSMFSGVLRASRHNAPVATTRDAQDTTVHKNIRILLWKSLIGSILVMLPTMANMVQFYITGGRELAVVCISLCLADGETSLFEHWLWEANRIAVSWDVLVLHW